MTPDTFRPTTNRMMNRFFEDAFNLFKPFTPFYTEETLPVTAWTPLCDIYETEKEIVLKVELPEVKKENVHITLENNMLFLRGERHFTQETERENYHRVERSYGEFMRSFMLPATVDPNKINATFKEGLLTITLPKRADAMPKQIEVKLN